MILLTSEFDPAGMIQSTFSWRCRQQAVPDCESDQRRALPCGSLQVGITKLIAYSLDIVPPRIPRVTTSKRPFVARKNKPDGHLVKRHQFDRSCRLLRLAGSMLTDSGSGTRDCVAKTFTDSTLRVTAIPGFLAIRSFLHLGRRRPLRQSLCLQPRRRLPRLCQRCRHQLAGTQASTVLGGTARSLTVAISPRRLAKSLPGTNDDESRVWCMPVESVTLTFPKGGTSRQSYRANCPWLSSLVPILGAWHRTLPTTTSSKYASFDIENRDVGDAKSRWCRSRLE